MTDTYLYEQAFRYEVGPFVCRIWHEDGFIDEATLYGLVQRTLNYPTAVKDMTFAVAQSKGVNSVEIVDTRTGKGFCVHKNWP